MKDDWKRHRGLIYDKAVRKESPHQICWWAQAEGTSWCGSCARARGLAAWFVGEDGRGAVPCVTRCDRWMRARDSLMPVVLSRVCPTSPDVDQPPPARARQATRTLSVPFRCSPPPPTPHSEPSLFTNQAFLLFTFTHAHNHLRNHRLEYSLLSFCHGKPTCSISLPQYITPYLLSGAKPRRHPSVSVVWCLLISYARRLLPIRLPGPALHDSSHAGLRDLIHSFHNGMMHHGPESRHDRHRNSGTVRQVFRVQVQVVRAHTDDRGARQRKCDVGQRSPTSVPRCPTSTQNGLLEGISNAHLCTTLGLRVSTHMCMLYRSSLIDIRAMHMSIRTFYSVDTLEEQGHRKAHHM